ncbi:Mur ligase family protein [Dokdonella sp.]|uniref:Mur ligase family protein n=1 Tax=Dokdonella sp. TaxID=2291710 RepID=UPI0031C4A1CE|nr:Mur ligase family protein [Dokdonella sp.]
MFKQFVQRKLENYVRLYFKKHPEVKLVVVAGSVGKTSTKTAISTVLSKKFRVRMHDGNHNTHMSAPLGILGIEYPENVHSLGQWIRVFRAAKKRINQPADVDVIVQELGTDRIGELAHFSTYLHPDIGVVTAVTPEHMEFFGSIETVAQEELTVANFSRVAIINRDDIDGRFAQFLTNQNVDTYGTTAAAEFRVEVKDFDVEHGFAAWLVMSGFAETYPADLRVIGEHSLRPICGAIAVAVKLGMGPQEIVKGVEDITPVPGRMNLLRGVEKSVLIDDTYNSSPASASAALQTLYSIQAPQRIAILGSMNELGQSSAAEHETLGHLCDPSLLAWVVTIGDEAEKYLAPAAKARGCQVKSFKSAIDAGAFTRSVMEEGAVILAKGSQGDIFAEEAVKMLLHSTSDDHMLVRQSPAWAARKSEFFSKFE